MCVGKFANFPNWGSRHRRKRSRLFDHTLRLSCRVWTDPNLKMCFVFAPAFRNLKSEIFLLKGVNRGLNKGGLEINHLSQV